VTADKTLIDTSQHCDGVAQLIKLCLDPVKPFLDAQVHTLCRFLMCKNLSAETQIVSNLKLFVIFFI
jgi:hypothetical protein